MTQLLKPNKIEAINAQVDSVLTRSTGQKLGIAAKTVGLLAAIHLPGYLWIRSDLQDAKAYKDLDKAFDETSRNIFKDWDDRIFGRKSNPTEEVGYTEIKPDGTETYHPASSDSGKNRKTIDLDAKDTKPKESFWKDPNKAALAFTAISTLVFSAFAIGSNFYRHNRAVSLLKKYYQAHAAEHPEAEVPSKERVLADYTKVIRYGAKVLEYDAPYASRSR